MLFRREQTAGVMTASRCNEKASCVLKSRDCVLGVFFHAENSRPSHSNDVCNSFNLFLRSNVYWIQLNEYKDFLLFPSSNNKLTTWGFWAVGWPLKLFKHIVLGAVYLSLYLSLFF